MPDNRAVAIRLLKHYFSQVYRVAGLRWDPDMDAEIEELVDAIIGASEQASYEGIVKAMGDKP